MRLQVDGDVNPTAVVDSIMIDITLGQRRHRLPYGISADAQKRINTNEMRSCQSVGRSGIRNRPLAWKLAYDNKFVTIKSASVSWFDPI